MKTAMQEAIEHIEEKLKILSIVQQTESTMGAKAGYQYSKYLLMDLLEKEKEQINILINALERIRDWDDEMHSEWDDQGEFASFTLKTYNQNK
jgi:hypothetical protein